MRTNDLKYNRYALHIKTSLMRTITPLKVFIFVTLFTVSARTEKTDSENRSYAENVRIDVSLASSDCLKNENVNINAFEYVVKNIGNKTITKLVVDLVFYDLKNEVLGKKELPLIFANKEFRETLSEDRKKEAIALPPGKSMKSGFNYIYLFLGETRLREEAKNKWNELTVVPKIKEIRTSE